MRHLTLVALLATTACSMTPKLALPAPPVADTYPVASGADALPAWRGMFGDPRLQRLIALSLDANRDLRVAALNAEAARAQARVQRVQSLPGLNAEGGYTRQRQPAGIAGAGVGLTPGSGAAGFGFGQFTAQAALTGFEVDLFGRLHALNEAAFQRWSASVEARRAVRLAVIGAVADAYWNERLADEQRALTRVTLADWRRSLDLTRLRRVAGQASGADVAQAEGLVRQAQADLAQRDREAVQATNALTLAVGAPLPADLPGPASLMDQSIRTALAAGVPSGILGRRPDIAQAEHDLRAANADIGAARAAFFPRISLTAAFGVASLALGGLFDGANRSWSYAPAISLPIFRGGELRGNLDLARLRTSSAVATYEKAIQTAFREVADGLAAQATYGTQLSEQRAVVAEAERRAALTNLAYRAGQASRLELLDAQRTTYASRQAALAVRRDQLIVRRRTAMPPHPEISLGEKRLAGLVHHAMLALIVIVPLMSYAMSSSFTQSDGVPFFGIDVPELLSKNDRAFAVFAWMHKNLAYTLLVLVAIHVAGVIKHRVLDHGKGADVLPRML